MINKQAEINNFRRQNQFYTTDAMRQIQQEYELQKNAAYRRKLYDWVINGRIGRKPQRGSNGN